MINDHESWQTGESDKKDEERLSRAGISRITGELDQIVSSCSNISKAHEVYCWYSSPSKEFIGRIHGEDEEENDKRMLAKRAKDSRWQEFKEFGKY